MGKKKTKTKNEPWAPAQPYILKNLQQQDDVFNAQQPELANYAKMQRDSYGKIAPGAEAGIIGSQSLVNDTIGGKYLNGNPFLEGILAKTRENTANSVAGQFSSAGRYGSGMHADILARAVAGAENEARYGNYAQERQNQIGAIGQAQSLMGGSQSLLNNAAELPWLGVQAANGAVRQASSGYGTQTTTQSGGLGSMLGGLAGAGLSGWAGGGFKMSDERLKANKMKIGVRPDGVGLYSYTMKPTGEPQIGVLAQDVAEKRPDALGPMVGGFSSVDYGKLGMPGPLTPGSGIGGDLPGMPAMPAAITTPIDMPQMGAEQPAKPKFFGEGGVGRGIAGALGDVLLQQAGMAPTYGPTIARQREAEAEEVRWGRRREAENADWRSREEWKAANREPDKPYRWEANDGSLMEIGPDGTARVAYQDPTKKTTYITVDNGDGTKQIVPIVNGQIMTGGGAAPTKTAPRGKLTPVGGPTATPSGTFR